MSEDLTKKLPSNDSEKLSLILTTVQNLETRVDHLEKKVDETRPIWQKVVADIAQLQQGQAQLQEGPTRLEGDVREIKVSVRDIYYKIDVLNSTMLSVQANHGDLDHRVRELEQHEKPTNSST